MSYKEKHVEAFKKQAKALNSRNNTQDSSAEEGCLEIRRNFYVEGVSKCETDVALEKWGTDDDWHEDLSVTCENCDGVLVHMYFGIEVRDNTIEDFKNWATGVNEIFDTAEVQLKRKVESSRA